MSHYPMFSVIGRFSRNDEANDKFVDVYVCRLRKKLGRPAIVNVWGSGYRLSDEMRERYRLAMELG